MNPDAPKKSRITTIQLKPLPPSRILYCLRVLAILIVPIAMTAFAINAPPLILIGLAAPSWLFAIALLVGFDAFRPRWEATYLVGVGMLVCGLLSVGGAVLNGMAIAMSPIGRDAPLLPYFFFGGLALQLTGVVVLFAGHKGR